MDVAAIVCAGTDVAEPLEVSLVGRREIRAAAYEPSDERRECVHDRAADGAGRERLRRIERGKRLQKLLARGEGEGRRLRTRLLCLVREAVLLESPRAEYGIHLVGDEETLLGIEAKRLLGGRKLLGAKRRAVAVGGVVLRRGAAADVRSGDDYRRGSHHLLGAAVDAVDCGGIVAVDLEDLPAIALEALFGVVGHREGGVTLDGDVVGVVYKGKVVELESARETRRLVGNALLEVAVAAEDPRAVRDLRLLRGKRKADAHRDALAERPRRNLDAGRDAALGVAGATAAPLTEGLELVHRKTAHAGKVKERVDEGRGVAAGEDQAVATDPFGILGVDVEVLEPEDGSEVGHAHRGAGVTGFCLFNYVRAKAADGVGDETECIFCDFHRRVLYHR